MIGSTISHFKILERIGGGGMGVVFKAEDLRVPGRIVALKILNAELVDDPDLKKRFLIEARAATSLDHPNICAIGEVDETDEGRPFMTMTYYGGASLRELLKKNPQDQLQALKVGYSTAQGLSCAHRHGIIHRDIKPGNIMINEDGYVKIVDFGLARLAGESRLTRSDMTLGTIAYMSPQQASGEDVDQRTDLWSLGVVLYEMLTGRLPFHGSFDRAMIHAIIETDHVPAHEANPDVPLEVSRIVDRCLAKNVEARYQTADAFIEDVLAVARASGWGDSITGGTVPSILTDTERIERDVDDGDGKKKRIFRTVTIAVAIALAAWAVYEFEPGCDPSPFSTDVRLAVLPVVSNIGPDYNAYGAGLAPILSDILERDAEDHDSMWVVPGKFVLYTDPVSAMQARDAFGVNRVVAGDIQRFGSEKRLTLRMLDGSGEELDAVVIDFAGATPGAEALHGAIGRLVGLEASVPGEGAGFLPGDDFAARDYTAAVGLLFSAPDSAEVLLESVRAAAPEFAPARTALGQGYFELYKRDYSEAYWDASLAELQAGRRIAPGDPRAHYQFGYVYWLAQMPDSAIACFDAALQIYPGYHLAARDLARTYRSVDRLDEAEAVFKASVELRRDFFSDHRALGMFYFRIAKYDEAIKSLNRALDLAPEDVYTLNTLGATYHQLSRWTEAREMFERSFEIKATCDNCNNVGLMYYYETRYWESARYYETALSHCDSTDHEAWGNWAAALYWVEGQRDRSVELCARAIELATRDLATVPRDANIISRLIDYYALSGMRAEALAMIERGRPYARNDADMAFRIGAAYELLGDRQTALEYIAEAIRRDYQIEIIERAPVLRDLRLDSRYRQMVASKRRETP